MLGERIKAVQKKLDTVVRRRGQSRRQRTRTGARSVSLVGYTNAGKSTLFNALTAAHVLAADKLFATLDPTMRRLPVPGLSDVVLADTVGFIGHLPHGLVEAFKATLEEVANADLLLHVVDATDPDVDQRISQVNEVLSEIGARELPTIIVYNKMDALAAASPRFSGELNAEGQAVAVAVSAKTGAGLPALIAAVGGRLGVTTPAEVLLQAGDGKTRAWLYRLGAVIDEHVRDDGSLALTVQADAELLDHLRRQPSVLLRPEGPLPRISPLPN
jgi:GTP-binding protein HflX